MTHREIAVVTGAAQGIGKAIVERLAGDGFRVIAVDRSTKILGECVDKLRACGLDVVSAPADVTDRASFTSTLVGIKRIDVMVTAAGIYNDAPFLDLDEESFRRMLDVNVVGTFIPAQEAARRMTAGGRIITISSRGALGGTRFAHYVASKAAVIGLTRAMAMELRSVQISVNSIAPGFTDTPMTRSAPPEMFAEWETLEPSGKAASPDLIANAVAFFASPNTHFITGQTLFVDGGKSLGGHFM